MVAVACAQPALKRVAPVSCSNAWHDILKQHWHLLQPLEGRRFVPFRGEKALVEYANCRSCHSTLCRQVPLMSIAQAEAEALRVWRAKTGLVDGELAAHELRSMARVYFTGDDE